MPKVSIVVPVYNMQKYLAACIKSLKAQTLSDLEIILVDDGSSDNSPALCDAYAQRAQRYALHPRGHHEHAQPQVGHRLLAHLGG